MQSDGMALVFWDRHGAVVIVYLETGQKQNNVVTLHIITS